MAVILCLGCMRLVAQDGVYLNAYHAAMEDSVVTEEEDRILRAIQYSLDLTDDEVLQIQRAEAQPERTGPTFSQEGRRRIIAQNMLLGNGLYGFGIPFVLGIDDGAILAGTQMLTFAGGFYYSWQKTAHMDIPQGRATFQNLGAVMGAGSIYPLMGIVGFENWIDIDPEFKLGMTYMMVSTALGVRYSDRLYMRARPSDGQAILIAGGAALGGFHGFFGQFILTSDFDDIEENWVRLNSLVVSGGALAGGYYIWRGIEGRNVTTGDAYLVSLGTSLGYIAGIEIIIMADPGQRESMAIMLLALDSWTYGAWRIGRDYDLTMGETGIISLGSTASAAVVRGVSLIIGLDQTAHILMAADIVAYTGGAYLTFKRLNIAPEASRKAGQETQLSLAPWPVLDKGGLKPGLSLEYRF